MAISFNPCPTLRAHLSAVEKHNKTPAARRINTIWNRYNFVIQQDIPQMQIEVFLPYLTSEKLDRGEAIGISDLFIPETPEKILLQTLEVDRSILIALIEKKCKLLVPNNYSPTSKG